MKTKGLTILAMFSLVPLFFCSLIFGLIGMDYWLKGGHALFGKIINGEVNNKTIAIMSMTTLLSISILFTFMITILRNSGHIDKLDQKSIDLENEI